MENRFNFHKKNIYDLKIISNKKINENIYLLELSKPQNFIIFPGQFINLQIDNNSYDPFLRRPFSIFNIDDKKIYILYLLKGKGTKILSEKRKGEFINIIGPLGNRFNIEKNDLNIFVAGGIGIATLNFLALNIKKGRVGGIKNNNNNSYNNKKNNNIKNILFYGVKNKDYLVKFEYFKNNFDEIFISMDELDKNNSFNQERTFSKNKIFGLVQKYQKGNVIDLLNSKISDKDFFENKIKNKNIKFYVCGPDPMLKSFIKWNEYWKFDAELSLESFMGCGFKACLGCAVLTKENIYKYVCDDGPVFKYDELVV